VATVRFLVRVALLAAGGACIVTAVASVVANDPLSIEDSLSITWAFFTFAVGALLI